MSVSGDDLSLSEGLPDELNDLLVGGGVSELLLHGCAHHQGQQPFEESGKRGDKPRMKRRTSWLASP